MKNNLIKLMMLVVASFIGMNGNGQTAYVSNGGSDNVYVINVATNTVTDTIAVGTNPDGVSVSSDGTTVYVANCDNSGSVSVINTASNAVTATIPVGSLPTCLCVSPDGSKVFVANDNDGTVSVITTSSNTVTATIPIGNNPWGVVVTPDGSTVYVVNDNDNANSVSVIDVASNSVIATIQVDVPNTIGNPTGIAVSPNGRWIYVTSQGTNDVKVINTTTNTVTDSITVGTAPVGIAVSPDGRWIYVANSQSNSLSVIDSATNTVTATIIIGLNPDGVSVSPDGSKVYVANQLSGTVSVINTATNTVTTTITVGQYPVSLGNFISTYAVITTSVPSMINETSNFIIYPNPASRNLNIHNINSQFSTLNSQLLITDLLGKEVYHETLTGIDNCIAITTWNAGIYFYEIRSESTSERGKFVVER